MVLTIGKLESLIKKYAQQYYIDGKSDISDAEFDKLVEELRKLDPDNKLLTTTGWGCEVVSDDLEVKPHLYPVDKFGVKLHDSANIEIPLEQRVVTVKLDGGSIVCYYEDGNLICALTRGDGINGMDVTSKIKYLVPTRVTNNFTGLVRGEIIIPQRIFNNEYAKYYESSRNLAIGFIKRKNLPMSDLSSLRLVTYKAQGVGDDSLDISTKTKVLDWLTDNGFNVVDRLNVSDYSNDNLRAIIKGYKKYLIDGLIITDNRTIPSFNGTLIHAGEQAYKTEAESADVKVTSIRWGVTSTAKLVPVINYDPISLSGATLRNATAYNAKFIKDNRIGIGCTARIQRQGEVIPKIIGVPDPLDIGQIPDECPICKGKLIWKGANLYCTNPDCGNKSKSDIFKWINTIAPTKSLGYSVLNTVIETFSINTIEDMVNFNDWEACYEIKGLGNSSVGLLKTMHNKLQDPIEFKVFLMACNIPALGWSTAEKLVPYADKILDDSLDKSEINNLLSGKIKSDALSGLISRLTRIHELANEYKIFIETTETKIDNDTDKGICITGSLGDITRGQFLKLPDITENGYYETSITKARYLITNDSSGNSSKLKKARERIAKGDNIQILSKDEFLNLLRK